MMPGVGLKSTNDASDTSSGEDVIERAEGCLSSHIDGHRWIVNNTRG